MMATMTVSRRQLYIKDPMSALTHFIGFVAALTATPFLIAKKLNQGYSGVSLLSFLIFSVSLMMLYLASTTYHTVDGKREDIILFKKLDHMMIFALIAGTYTPICLTVLRDSVGLPLLIAVWSVGIVGMLFKLFWVTCPKIVSSIMYIAMGWLCVFAFPAIFRVMSMYEIKYLLSGGIVYTIGGVIYALKSKSFN
ncbi:MAG: hemolysin III family protein, partial [Sphaerochaetaceae bacterium]|nr:hemolysin III family protein [Sphaerochaetaceae bacterium]